MSTQKQTQWTDEQRRVIDARGCNLLVAAAAGSGKTAVLTERILSLITDPKHPTDIDRLLVVTFTRAAAAELRDRIGNALEQRLEDDPENAHLQRQSALLPHAQISTIHSFCTAVIRNYCHLIDLDPGYRVADEGELRMIQGKVLEELIEERYAENEPSFRRFSDAYAPGKNDRQLEVMIQKLYEFAIRDPDPDAWLDSCRNSFLADSEEKLFCQPWMLFILEETGRTLSSARQLAEENLQLAELPDGPQAWQEAIRQDHILVNSLCGISSFPEFQERFQNLDFMKLSTKKPGTDEEKAVRLKIKENRESLKKMLQSLREEYFRMTAGEILEELAFLRPYAEELITLTKQYGEAFSAAKRKKNVCDYSDLEHYALAILLEKKEDGSLCPGKAARELALRYDEIMVDEYQDSNYIQEALLCAVAGHGDGRQNRFMVGDIKQSIYGFRNARPELFLEKYDSYGSGGSEGVRIDLHRNFRSRSQVLSAVNLLFRQLMTRDLGGISYDAAAELYPGADYPDPQEPAFPDTELLLTVAGDPDGSARAEKKKRIEAEAKAAALRINELMRSASVWDRSLGAMRPMQYRDCVILLRTAAGWADIFVRVLKENGIPAYTLSKEGYFSATEVETVLSCLRITDNPRQEIPYTAVLHSPAVGCTDRDLAQIRLCDARLPIFEIVERLADPQGEMAGRIRPDLQAKLAEFVRLLHSWREDAPILPVHELIRKILSDTGYGEYAAAMPGGSQRQANLLMLIEKAVTFEQTGTSGLFNFIRYIEKMQKYSIESGEVSLYSEAENIVRVTTIHKSKGLEYPVVFVSGLGKRFNMQDQNSSLVLQAQLGMGMNLVDTELRLRKPSLMLQAVRTACSRDLLSEELRILYVAMTRAKEKLILTGMVKDPEDLPEAKEDLTYRHLTGVRCPLDWILQAKPFMDAVKVRICRDSQPDAEEEHAKGIPGADAYFRMLTGMAGRKDTGIRSFLERREAFRYPYEAAAELPAKMTVSEIKKASVEAMMEEKGEELYPEEAVIPYIPSFMKTEHREEVTGAERGTVYHHVLELLDYRQIPSGADGTDQAEETAILRKMLDQMAEKGQLKAEERSIVAEEDILTFLHSGIGRRMKEASGRGKLWRERPFVLDLPAKEIDRSWPEGENILVQGVIDAWFEENGSYVLVDYKTDRVSSADGRELSEKYAPQLALYRRALETLTGMRVTEMYLYSVTLGREIAVEL